MKIWKIYLNLYKKLDIIQLLYKNWKLKYKLKIKGDKNDVNKIRKHESKNTIFNKVWNKTPYIKRTE